MYSSPDSDSELPYMEPPSNEALEPIRKPPPYTGTPLFLFLSDIKLFFQDFFYLPYLFIPLYPWKSGPFCELYPSRENLIGITIHCILSVTQFAFLLSLFTLSFLPTFVSGLKSTEDGFTRSWPRHDDEAWIFLNGICVGKNWFQKNIDLISQTFHRPVVGIHN
ncbi:Urea amidolyase [Fusarium oxysporum f. sp. albedinis]|nr:Urea amidolyase [Fusarium oxysporum f. sp. albedinis]